MSAIFREGTSRLDRPQGATCAQFIDSESLNSKVELDKTGTQNLKTDEIA